MTKTVASRRLSILGFINFLVDKGRRRKAQVFHSTLEKRFQVSRSTVIRDLRWLRDKGYIDWTLVPASHGGDKCNFTVLEAGKAYLLLSQCLQPSLDIPDDIPEDAAEPLKKASEASVDPSPPNGKILQSNSTSKDNSRDTLSSLSIYHYLQEAALIGVQGIHLVWLKKAALVYGVERAWMALWVAWRRGCYSVERLDRVVWGMLRKQHQGMLRKQCVPRRTPAYV